MQENHLQNKAMDDFDQRLEERKEELSRLLDSLYGCDTPLSPLLDGVSRRFAERSIELRRLDEERVGNNLWFMENDSEALTLYVDLFCDNLNELGKRIPYLKELGVTYLHIMPIMKMPKYDNDGGYAVDDYLTVDPRFGVNGDFITLVSELHECGIAICIDFVLNHTSSTHIWAEKAKAGDEKYIGFYQTYPDRTIPDEFEKTVPEVFPSTAPGNFVWSNEMERWVFSSFYPFQWDLDYHNPNVLVEMALTLLDMANMGVDVFRLDAIPYIWKQLGTSCRNLPQVHTILRILRLVAEIVAPGIVLKGEVVMEPRDLKAYFGSKSAPECHMLYGVSLMANLWSCLASQDVRLLNHQTEELLSMPDHCRFLNYIRCHDDIGWGLDEDEERRLGINPLLHKQFLYRFYEGSFSGSYARGRLYNFDSETLDARTCGTAASLVGFESAVTDEDEDKAYGRLRVMYGTIYAMKGIPMISSGDEIGQLNDYSYSLDPKRRYDSRNVHRRNFDWAQANRRRNVKERTGRIWNLFENLRKARRGCPLFDPDAIVTTWDSHNSKVFALRRTKGDDCLLCVSSFSDNSEKVRFTYFYGIYKDVFTGKTFEPGIGFEIEPHGLLWLKRT